MYSRKRLRPNGTTSINKPDAELADIVSKRTALIISDNIPEHSTYPWISTSGSWTVSPGPLQEIKATMQPLVNRIRTDAGRFIESAYFGTWLPKNYRNGRAMFEKLNTIQWKVPRPYLPLQFNEDRAKRLYGKVGLGRTVGDYSIDAITCVQPGRNQASNGVTSDGDNPPITGPKIGQWTYILERAIERYARWEELGLTWSECNPEEGEKFCTDEDLYYVPTVRIDGNPNNPRLIWMANSEIYPLESIVVEPMKKDMKKSDAFAFTIGRTQQRVAALKGSQFINLDISRWDLSQYWECQKLIYKVWAEMYKVPEWLMVPLANANMFAPIWLPDGTRTCHKQQVIGMARSGSGIFVPGNNLLNLLYQDIVCELTAPHEYDESYGQVFGDNTMWPTHVGAEVWADALKTNFGITAKASESVVTKDVVIMLRRLVNVENTNVEPVVASRCRNALTSAYIDPWNLPEAVVATIYRAQAGEIYLAHSETRKYRDIIEAWHTHVAPKQWKDSKGITHDLWMSKLSDEELCTLLPSWAWSVRDALDWTKRVRGVRDLGKVIDDAGL